MTNRMNPMFSFLLIRTAEERDGSLRGHRSPRAKERPTAILFQRVVYPTHGKTSQNLGLACDNANAVPRVRPGRVACVIFCSCEAAAPRRQHFPTGDSPKSSAIETSSSKSSPYSPPHLLICEAAGD